MAVERNYAPKRLLWACGEQSVEVSWPRQSCFYSHPAELGKGCIRGRNGEQVDGAWRADDILQRNVCFPAINATMQESKKLHLHARLGGRWHSEAETLPKRPPMLACNHSHIPHCMSPALQGSFISVDSTFVSLCDLMEANCTAAPSASSPLCPLVTEWILL